MHVYKNWTPAELSSLDGRTYLITGGNSGIGLEATQILTDHGANVVIGCRSAEKAMSAISLVNKNNPKANVQFVALDLTDPDSISAAVAKIEAEHPKLDALINNAGVMQPPLRRTKEGFELQMGTNHLGHFRLSAQLYPLLKKSEGRIVTVSSVAHKWGKINLDDLQSEKSYEPTVAYCQSKLANLMFAFELDRRLQAANSPVKSMGSHPGYSATNLQSAGVGMEGGSALMSWMYSLTNKLVAQSALKGSYPQVLAAADEHARSGAYYGPTGLMDCRGPVSECFVHAKANDEDVAGKLWEQSEALVGAWSF